MPNSETFSSDSAPAAVGPYSQAIASTVPGRLVFLSGQIGLDPGNKDRATLVEGGIEAETLQVIKNIRAVLAAIGLGLSDILRIDIDLTDMGNYAKMNAIYAAEFGDHKPARATRQVAGLPLGAKIEMTATAWQSTVSDKV